MGPLADLQKKGTIINKNVYDFHTATTNQDSAVMLEVSFSEKTGTIKLCGPKTSFLCYSCNNASSKKHPAFNLDYLYCCENAHL